VPLIAIDWGLGWRMTFLITGLPAVLVLAVWLIVYRRPEDPSARGRRRAGADRERSDRTGRPGALAG